MKSERKTTKKLKTNDARQQTAIDCLYSDIHTRSNSNNLNNVKHNTITMDAKTIDNIEATYKSAEVTELTTRWREIVKPGIYRMTGGRWKHYHEPKFLRNESKVIEERLQQLTNNTGTKKTSERESGRKTREAFNPKPVILNNGRWIHYGRWTGQPQSN